MTSIFSSVFNELKKEKDNSHFKTKDYGTFALAEEHRVLDLNPLGDDFKPKALEIFTRTKI